MKIAQTLTAKKRSLRTRFALAFASVTSVAILGSAGLAAASPAQKTMYLPNREACSSQWQAFHFRGRDDCENYWNNHRHSGQDHQGDHGNNNPGNGNSGHGYGGGNTTVGGVTVIVNGNNNVINIVINYFFGS